jgi:hypothetical protein
VVFCDCIESCTLTGLWRRADGTLFSLTTGRVKAVLRAVRRVIATKS